MSRYYVVLEIPVHEMIDWIRYVYSYLAKPLKKHIIQSSRKPTGLGFSSSGNLQSWRL
jgi:hypothetical protein